MMYYLKQRSVITQLILLAYAWSSCSFCYYMIGFLLKYLPGDIYDNTYAAQLSEIIGFFLASIIYAKLDLKPSFFLGYSIAIIGGILIIFVGDNHTELMPIFVIMAKFGICISFQLVFIATILCFPADFGGRAFGFCNFFSRGVSIGAP